MNNKINYTKTGDYYIPDLVVPKNKFIGKYGRLHLKYLKENRNGFYTSLLITGRLNDYLYKIDIKAKFRLEMLIKNLAEEQGVTEKLKAKNQMEWVGRINNIKNIAEEVVYKDIVFNRFRCELFYKSTY